MDGFTSETPIPETPDHWNNITIEIIVSCHCDKNEINGKSRHDEV